MTDEQYESLRRHILDVKVEIEALKLVVRQLVAKQDEAPDSAAARFMESIEQIEMPDDIRKLMKL